MNAMILSIDAVKKMALMFDTKAGLFMGESKKRKTLKDIMIFLPCLIKTGIIFFTLLMD